MSSNPSHDEPTKRRAMPAASETFEQSNPETTTREEREALALEALAKKAEERKERIALLHELDSARQERRSLRFKLERLRKQKQKLIQKESRRAERGGIL